MVECIALTQGALAREWVESSEMIVGRPGGVRALCLDWDAEVEDSRRRLAACLAACDDRPVLLLTDVFGSTPYRLAVERREPGRVEVISGTNLPMVIYLSLEESRGGELAEVVAAVLLRGRTSVRGEGPAIHDLAGDKAPPAGS